MKNLTISELCTENWSEMAPTNTGAFCQKCSHDVLDVTGMRTQEIEAIFRKNLGKRTCMRMTPRQEVALNHNFNQWKVSKDQHLKRTMLFSLLVVFGLTLFSCNTQEGEKQVVQLQEIARTQVDREAHPTLEDTVKEAIQETQVAIEKPVLIEEPALLYVDFDQVFVEEIPPSYVLEDMHMMGAMRMTTAYEEYLVEPIAEIIQPEYDAQGRLYPTSFAVKAYPNPAITESHVEISMPEASELLMIRLLDMQGSVLSEIHNQPSDRGTFDFPVNLSNLSPGTYLVDVRSGNNHEVTRIVKAQ